MHPLPLREWVQNDLLESLKEDASVNPMPPAQAGLKQKYLRKAIDEYEYSSAPEYDKLSMSLLAAAQGTLDFDYDNADSAVELSIDGAWVDARVWVPKQWIQTD